MTEYKAKQQTMSGTPGQRLSLSWRAKQTRQKVGERRYYHLHFIPVNEGTEEFGDLPKTTQEICTEPGTEVLVQGLNEKTTPALFYLWNFFH